MNNSRRLCVFLFVLLAPSISYSDHLKGLSEYQAGHFDRALAEWKKSAAVGDTDSQFSIGSMYANGRGVPSDDEEAARWYAKAAFGGNSKAQFNLCWMYANGRCVEKNLFIAKRCFQLAAQQGQREAEQNLLIVERLMKDTKTSSSNYSTEENITCGSTQLANFSDVQTKQASNIQEKPQKVTSSSVPGFEQPEKLEKKLTRGPSDSEVQNTPLRATTTSTSRCNDGGREAWCVADLGGFSDFIGYDGVPIELNRQPSAKSPSTLGLLFDYALNFATHTPPVVKGIGATADTLNYSVGTVEANRQTIPKSRLEQAKFHLFMASRSPAGASRLCAALEKKEGESVSDVRTRLSEHIKKSFLAELPSDLIVGEQIEIPGGSTGFLLEGSTCNLKQCSVTFPGDQLIVEPAIAPTWLAKSLGLPAEQPIWKSCSQGNFYGLFLGKSKETGKPESRRPFVLSVSKRLGKGYWLYDIPSKTVADNNSVVFANGVASGFND